jgi:hypothetical protein
VVSNSAVLIAIVAGVVIAAVTFGLTLASFQSLQIADEVEHCNGIYLLNITNLGSAKSMVPLWLEEVADQNGPIAIANTDLPLELIARDHEPGKPVVCGIPFKVQVLYVHSVLVNKEHKRDRVVVAFNNERRTVILDPSLDVTTKTKLWLKIAIGSECRWLSIAPSDVDSTVQNTNQLVVRFEDPPFITPGWWSQLKAKVSTWE